MIFVIMISNNRVTQHCIRYGKRCSCRAGSKSVPMIFLATKVREGGWKLAFKSEKSINAYITITDPLNNIQNRSMLLPSVNGNRKYVLPNRINGYSIYNFY